MTPAPLTFRASRDGATSAAYLGTCRVGYALASGLWWTNLLRPEGGCWTGRAPSPEAAQEALAGAVGEWVAHAELCSAGPAAALPGASAGPVPGAVSAVDETEAASSTPVKKGPIRSKRIL